MDVWHGWVITLLVACLGLLAVVLVVVLNYRDELRQYAKVRRMELTEPQKMEIIDAIRDRDQERAVFETATTSRLKILSAVTGGLRKKLDRVFYPDPPPLPVSKHTDDPES